MDEWLYRPGLHHVGEPDHPATGEGDPPDLSTLSPFASRQAGWDDPACRFALAMRKTRESTRRPRPRTRISFRKLNPTFPTFRASGPTMSSQVMGQSDLDAMK